MLNDDDCLKCDIIFDSDVDSDGEIDDDLIMMTFMDTQDYFRLM